MARRHIEWSPLFGKKYRQFQDEAVERLESDDDGLLKQFLLLGETLKILASAVAQPEGDPRLDTHPYHEISRRALAESTLFGSRLRAESADFRVFWRQDPGEDNCLLLVDLLWPCT